MKSKVLYYRDLVVQNMFSPQSCLHVSMITTANVLLEFDVPDCNVEKSQFLSYLCTFLLKGIYSHGLSKNALSVAYFAEKWQ